MSTLRFGSGNLRLALTGTCMLVVAGGSASAETARVPTGGSAQANVRVDDLSTAEAVRRAIAGAEEWLEQPECRRVFSDFEDLSGRRLTDTLAERGTTGRGHLGLVYFYDGSHLPMCKRGGVAAVTAPGSHVVFVCPGGFQKHCSDPVDARATIVHELLHTLGLGENPPSSHQITARVMQRCCR